MMTTTNRAVLPDVEMEPDVLRSKLKDNIKAFGYIIFKHLIRLKTNCPLHTDIQRVTLGDSKYNVIIAPRGNAKTSWASTIGILHDICYERYNVIVLIKKNFTQAINDLQNIVIELKENELLQDIYGGWDFLIDRQEKIEIRNKRTGKITYIASAGTGQSIRGLIRRGKRVGKFLLDDFEDEKNTATPELRDKVRKYMSGQVLPCLDPDKGRIFAIGTIVHFDSWLNARYEDSLKAKELKRDSIWDVTFYALEDKDGKAIFPELFTPTYIKNLKALYGELGQMQQFYQEYYNIPYDPENVTFPADMLKYLNWRFDHEKGVSTMTQGSRVEVVDVVIAYDPSGGTATGDFVGSTVLLTDKDNNRYNERADRYRWKPNELIDHIFSDHAKYHPRLIIVEAEAMAVLLQYWLHAEMRRRNIYLPLVPYKSPKDAGKAQHIRDGLQPVYSAGVVFHKHSQVDAVGELVSFPKQRHDDIMDSMLMAHKYARPPGSSQIRRAANPDAEPVRQRYNWKTGARVEAKKLLTSNV